MPDRDAVVTVRLTQERKDEWDEFRENTRMVDGQSDLVRRAVSAYIAANGDPSQMGQSGGNGSNVPDDLSNRLAGIEDQLSEVATTVEHIDSTTGFIGEKITERNVEKVSDRIISIIPPAKPFTSEWKEKRDNDKKVMLNVAWDGTIESIAEHASTNTKLVEQAIDSIIENDFISIQREEIDGEMRVWRNDG